jgi:hypothetical protein
VHLALTPTVLVLPLLPELLAVPVLAVLVALDPLQLVLTLALAALLLPRQVLEQEPLAQVLPTQWLHLAVELLVLLALPLCSFCKRSPDAAVAMRWSAMKTN